MGGRLGIGTLPPSLPSTIFEPATHARWWSNMTAILWHGKRKNIFIFKMPIAMCYMNTMNINQQNNTKCSKLKYVLKKMRKVQ